MKKVWKAVLWTLPIIITTPLISTIYFANCTKINDDLTIIDNEYLDIYKQMLDKNPNLSYIELNSLVSEVSNRFGIDNWHDWIYTLTYNDWERDSHGNALNLYCKSERQALFMYTQLWGDFWNYYLHHQISPPDGTISKDTLNNFVKTNKDLSYKGNDYIYMSNALEKACTPCNLIVYHGVEFMEDEFYDQLKDYIKYDELNNDYDYSECVGKTITSYGFMSTSTSIKVVSDFTGGDDWMHGGIHLPLKEPFIFRIKIPKNTFGIGYMSGYPLMNSPYDSCDESSEILINRNTNFSITGYYKLDDGNNLFELTLE